MEKDRPSRDHPVQVMDVDNIFTPLRRSCEEAADVVYPSLPGTPHRNSLQKKVLFHSLLRRAIIATELCLFRRGPFLPPRAQPSQSYLVNVSNQRPGGHPEHFAVLKDQLGEESCCLSRIGARQQDFSSCALDRPGFAGRGRPLGP